MVDLLISFLVFVVIAAIFLYALKLACGWISGWLPTFSQFTPLIMGAAYIIVGLTGLLKYIVPILRSLADMAGLR